MTFYGPRRSEALGVELFDPAVVRLGTTDEPRIPDLHRGGDGLEEVGQGAVHPLASGYTSFQGLLSLFLASPCPITCNPLVKVVRPKLVDELIQAARVALGALPPLLNLVLFTGEVSEVFLLVLLPFLLLGVDELVGNLLLRSFLLASEDREVFRQDEEARSAVPL